MTDVAGVLDGKEVLEAVSCDGIDGLVRQNKVSGGMILKLEACRRALNAGVKQVHIVGGTGEDGLLSASAGRGELGTRVLAARPAQAGARNE
jgi:acetylglutamate kinase